jgi:hypothetical protein
MEPDKEINTNKSPERAKQDMEFGESMETDMNRYSREMAGKAMDSSWMAGVRDDGNKNLGIHDIEAGQDIKTGRDLEFADKMYSPDTAGNTSSRSRELTKQGTEFGRDYELEVEKQTSPYAGGSTEGANRRLRSSIPPRVGMDTEFAADIKPDSEGGTRTNKSSKNDKKVY